MKKIFNLLLGASILMSSSTYIYANNIEESQNLNNTYTRINNYINQGKEYNLLDMTFNKYIVSILNENNDLYNIYNYKEHAPLSNINLLLTQSLMQTTHTLTILSNVSNIAPTSISHIVQTFNDGDDYTDSSFGPSLHAAGAYYDSISNGYYKLYGNFWWEGTSSKTERNTSWYDTPPIPNDVYKPNAVEIGSKAVLGYEVENIQWYSPSSAPTPKARPGRWTHEKRCYVNYRRALTTPQTGSISVGNAYRASNSLYWVKENASAHVNYSATQDFNGRDFGFEDYITTNYIYFAVNGNKGNSPYITNGRWAYNISNYNSNSLLSVSFKGTNADNAKGDTNRTMHSSVYVSLKNNGTEVELGGKADSANGKSSALSWSGIKIKCDAKNPTANINVSSFSNSATVRFSASDGESGLSSIQYKLSGAQNQDWTNIGNNGSISITALGTTTIYVRATDNVGNTYETSKTVTIDTLAPTVTHTINPTGWTNRIVTINLTASDAHSGLKNIILPNNSITTSNVASYAVGSNGTYTFKATDNAGNVTTYHVTITNIDKIAPVINNIPANNSIYGGKATLNLNATDSGGSGMKSLTLYKNNVSIVTGPNALSYIENDVGAHTYKVVALDNAGNTTEKTFTLTVVKKPNIDSLSVVKSDYKESNSVYWVRPNVNGVLQIKTQASFPSSYGIYPTETQLGLGKPNYTNGVSSLAWATTSRTGSSGSEFASNFTLNNGINKANTSSTNNKNILTFTHTLTPKLDNTNYTLYSSGKYNNEQANFVNSNIIIKTDGTAPTMTITSPIPTGWTNKDVMISFTSSDNRSGVKTNQIKYTGTNTAPNEVTLDNRNRITFTNTDKYSVTLLSIDKVGNISKTSGSFGIDKINPVIGTTPSNGTKYLDMTTLNITSTDAGGSLMKSLTLYRNNIKVKEGVDSVSYFENINGTHTFKVVAKDNAGNVSEREFTITILEDKINLITTPNNPKNLIRLEWSHQNLLNKSYTVYQKRDDASMFNVVPGTGDKFTQRVFDNKYASDVTPPNIPNVSFIEETDTDVKYTILPTEDNGTTYKFYVVSKDNHGKLTQSNTATDTVKTGVKGYAYIVDGKTTTIPNKQVNVTVDVSKIVAPIQGNFDHYLHIAAIDNAGNMGPVNHILIWEAVKNNWFNQEIAKQVRKDYSNLRISDYRRIETIALRNKNISGEIPKDIKKTINLVELDLYRNSINDISNLKNLTKLEYLDLGNNRISDISTLTGLTELTDLNIYNNNVSDISVVAHMPNLERLYIHKNNITDISVVEQLNYLEEFYFEFNYINLTDPTTIRIIEKFENQGCYVVSAPQNIVRANDKDIVELNIGDEFIPTTILGLSENNIDIIGEHSILRALDINYLSSDTNIVDIQNNKLIALSEGEATITVVHKQFRNIATVSFTIKVIDPNKELDENIADLEDVIIDNDGDNIIDDNITNDDIIIDNNVTNDDNVVEDNLTDDNSTSEQNKPSINESESNNNTEPNKDTDTDNNTDTEKIEEEVNDSTQNNANNTNNSNEEVSMIEQLE